jgi:thiamine kinase-like enzyme
VPCHNDLLAANILWESETSEPDVAQKGRIWLIDFEYGGNNDPCFELGNIWSEAVLPPELLAILVIGYFRRPRPSLVARSRLHGLMSKYGWMLWASISEAVSDVDFDSQSCGLEKYDRAVAEFDGPDLPVLLEACTAVD